MVLSDKEIRRLIEEKDMISYFASKKDGISSGVSSYGFDAQLGNRLFIFDKVLKKDYILDPKDMGKETLKTFEIKESEEYFILPPHSFALGKTREYYKIPNDILVICLGKSTYARCGLIVNVTPLEPGWEGNITLEISNTTSYAAKIYVNEGICQLIFFKGNEPCEVTYKDKKGKYMFQNDITLSR